MKGQTIFRAVCFLGVFVFALGVMTPIAWSAGLRITMTDGTSVEVPYFWEEGGQVKFETAGGVAGVPKSQVASVQEVIASREFDPEAILEGPENASETDQQKKLQALVAAEIPSGQGEKLDMPEALQALKRTEKVPTTNERVETSLFRSELDFAQLDRHNGNQVVLKMRKILSSKTGLGNRDVVLTLYDGNGNVIQRQPCQLVHLNLDRKTLRELGIRGQLYAVTASVKVDPQIKRYEITTARSR